MTAKPVRMRGTPSLDITVDLSTAEWGTNHVRLVLTGSLWMFYPDGRCLLVEGPAASARDDLYPLPGRWQSDANTVSVDLKGSTESGVTVHIRGNLTGHGTDPFHSQAATREAVHTTRSPHGERRLVIRQALHLADQGSPAPAPTDPGTVPIQLNAGPLTYAVVLSGHDGVRAFTDVRTRLVLRPAPSPDRGPVRFSLGADAIDVIGGIVWMSHLDGDESLREYDSTITISGNNLAAHYEHDAVSIAVTWLRASLPFLPSAPVIANRADLNLTFIDRTVRGHVQALGTVPSSSLHYRGDFVGTWVDPNQPRSRRSSELATATWR